MKTAVVQTASTWSGRRLAEMRAADAVALAHPRMEHRWGQRRPCCAHVCVSARAGVSGSARMRDVSLSGAFLETTLPLPLFSQIAIAVRHDDGSTYLMEFTATVVRSELGGVGIEWCEPVSGSICRHLGCNLKCAAAPAGSP